MSKIDRELDAFGAMKADLEKQRKELKDYVRKQAVDKCLESLPLSVVECGIAAKNLDERAACEKQ